MAELEDEFFIDYAKLDDIQRSFVDRQVNRHMVVTGTAGSGKSLIALHKAKEVSKLGSYTIVVFTKSLRRYFENGLKKLGLTNVYHYHDWKKEKPHVKYLIVDECQDFSSQEIEELRKCAEICFFFGDTDQTIMSFRGNCFSVDDTAKYLGLKRAEPLYTNYRLTIENAKLAEVLGNVDDVEEKCVRHGEKPKLIKKNSIESQIDEIIRLKNNNSLSSIGVLMPYNTKRTASNRCGNEKFSVEFVKDYIESKGFPVEYKYRDRDNSIMDLDFHSSNIKVLTWWCAKGLQFKDVFLLNCNADYEEEKRKALYVAATRASERLYLLYSGTLSSMFPEPESEIYAGSELEDLFLFK